jgi:phosphatidylcholine synthase
MIATVCGYLVHAYTASGVIWGWLAIGAAFDGNPRAALLWLVVASIVDATDGALARLAQVTRTAPLVDGGRLDDIVDYVTFVIAPAAIVWRVPLVPPGWDGIAAGSMLLASAFGFARRDSKTADHLFTGFPSYWNVVAAYLAALQWPLAVNAWVILVLAALVFVPVRYVYPSRTTTLRGATVALGAVWSVQMVALIWQLPQPSRPLLWSTWLFPAYYVVLSLWLTARRGATGPRA